MLQIDAKPPKITFSQNIFEFSMEVMATWGIFLDLCGFGWQQLTGVYRLPVQVGLSTSRLETAVPCSKFYQEKRKKKKKQRSHFETGPLGSLILYINRVLKVKVVSNSLWHHGLYSPPSSSVHGILQARILEWVAIPSPVDLPYPGIFPTRHVLHLLHWQAGSLPAEPAATHSSILAWRITWTEEPGRFHGVAKRAMGYPDI